MIKVCTIRLDDITPDMDWDRFFRLKGILDKYRIKPLIGVVPDNQDPGLHKEEARSDFWEWIRTLQQDGWAIAQHGYRHVYETTNSGLLGLKNASEFAGLTYEIQYEKLKKGKEILSREGIESHIFMAPGHTFDKNTVKALKELGFTLITDGYTRIPYFRHDMLFVPCRKSRFVLEKGLDTICIHTNELTDEDYREIDRFLTQHRSSVRSFSEVEQQILFPQMRLLLKAQEKSNLLVHRAKKAMAESVTCQNYMQDTFDENARKKQINRCKAMPGLVKDLAVEAIRKRKEL